MLAEATPKADRLRKLRGSCDVCRQKKVRCDSSVMPQNICTNCISSKTTCTHTHGRSKSPEIFMKTAQQHVAEILSASVVYVPSDDAAATHRILVQVALYARCLEEKVTSLLRSTPTSNTSLAPISMAPGPEMAWADVSADTISIRDPLSSLVFSSSKKNIRFYGESSSVQFIRATMKYLNGNTRVYATQRSEFWTIQPWEKSIAERPQLFFPENDLIDTLVDLYLAQIHPIFGVLHPRTFRQSVTDGLHFRDPHYGAVLLAVCALASRYSDDARVFLDGTQSQHSCGWKWFRQTRALWASGSLEPSLFQLQLIALSLLYMTGSSTPEECWILAGVGVRLAQGAGAHIRSGYAHMDPLHKELFKRVFWILVTYDVLMSALEGRPQMTQEADLSIDLPVDLDDECGDHADESSNVAFSRSYLKLIKLFGRIQNQIYPADGRMCDPDKVVELDSELNKWADSIPEQLRWNPQQENNILLNQSAALYAIYYHAQMLIHRPFIPTPSTPSTTIFPSLAICANAARSCGHVLSVQAGRGHGFLYHPHVMTALLDSAVILLINVWKVDAGGSMRSIHDFARANADVQNCISVLQLYERRWRVAGRKVDIIAALLNLDMRSLEGVSPSLKRARNWQEQAGVLPLPSRSLPSLGISKERRVAGSSRVKRRQALEISAREPSHLVQSLPLHTAELGGLPVYDSFEYAFNENLHSSLPFQELYSDTTMDLDAQMLSGLQTAPDMTDLLQSADDCLSLAYGPAPSYSWRDWSVYLADVDEH